VPRTDQRDGNLKESEAFDLQSSAWLRLANMAEARCVFNPCEYEKLVYLCGGWTSTIETFDPETCIFQLLPIQLPENDYASLAVVENAQLLVMCEVYVTRWHFNSEHNLVQVSQEAKTLHCRVASNMPVQVDSVNDVVYVVFNSECYGIKLDGSWVEDTGESL